MATTVKKLAVLTGASSGIGYELARQFAQNDYDLIIASEEGNIEEAAEFLRGLGTSVLAMQSDLRDYNEVERFYALIQSASRPVDAIAINAGVGVGGPFIDNCLEEEFAMIDLNVKSAVHIAKRVINDMAVRNEGKVLFTASVVPQSPAPYQAVYSGTKAFILNFAESIRTELKDTNITVTSLMPGATETNFFHRAGLDDTKVGQSDKDNPADVAKDGFEALMRGDDKVVAHSLKSKAQGIMGKLLPDKMNASVLGKMSEPGSASKQ